MAEFFGALDQLRQILQNDPELQARLFEIRGAEVFVETLSQLAIKQGQTVSTDELHAALRQGRRDWIERELP